MKQHASRPRVARLLVDENRSWELKLITKSIRSTTSCSSKTYSETRKLYSFLYHALLVLWSHHWLGFEVLLLYMSRCKLVTAAP
jgi:hypothetical protein